MSKDTSKDTVPPPPAKRPYHVPQTRDPADLEFTPRPMVAWFRPLELIRAGVKALLSSLFGAYADKREVQAALTLGLDEDDLVVKEFADQDELWFDFVADLGDGFAATYAVARMVGAETLTVDHDGVRHETRRGQFLVLGGDQVYPAANAREYQDRFVGPYQAAMPYVPDESNAPGLLAIPGNHDWYDGLTAFSRLFTQPRWIGGWRTRQRRSYFAVNLGRDWWLWGIDVQLGSEVDQPQIDYFCYCATKLMSGPSKVVLCTAEPAWVYKEIKGKKGAEAYKNLEYFERKIIRKNGHELVVGLSGDLHAYARWERDGAMGKQHRFVAGGGGAYLHPTHDFPATLRLPHNGAHEAYVQPPTATEQGVPVEKRTADSPALFPAAERSRRMTWGALAFPLKNLRFSIMLGGFYLVFAWIVQSASRMLVGGGPSAPKQSFLETIASRGLSGGNIVSVADDFVGSLVHSPFAVLVLAALVVGLLAFADADDRKTVLGIPYQKALLGLPHAAAHIALLLGAMWVFAHINLEMVGLKVNSVWQVFAFSFEMYVVGGLAGGVLMGLYLFLANRLLHRHTNEVFLCQSIRHHKHFLRLRRDAQGGLTIYPIGIDEVPAYPKGWRFDGPRAAEGGPWFEPEGDSIEDRVRLIEPPIVAGPIPNQEPAP